LKNGQWEMDLTEPKMLMKQCAEIGMPLFNVSMGFPRFQPYMNRPHDNSLAGMPSPPEYPLDGVVRFQQTVREMQHHVPQLPVVTAGLAWLRHLMPQVAAGLVEKRWCTLIGQGRGAFAYPDSVRDILKKGLMNPSKCCTTCSLCSQIMKDGLGKGGCVVRDKAIYAPEFLKGRRL
jgi:2,4-dienoyl-CoA reductase (NADPH2)